MLKFHYFAKRFDIETCPSYQDPANFRHGHKVSNIGGGHTAAINDGTISQNAVSILPLHDTADEQVHFPRFIRRGRFSVPMAHTGS